MATNKLATDIAGSSLTFGENDFRRDRATRRILYFHTGDKEALITFIRTDSGDGETYAADGTFNSGGDLVHPENTDLPLQLIQVTKVGRNRWMAILQYFRILSGGHGGSATSLVNFRVSLQAMRVYTDGAEGGEFDWLWSYALPGGNMLMDTESGCPGDGDGGDGGDGDGRGKGKGGGHGFAGEGNGDDRGTTESDPRKSQKSPPNNYSRVITLPIVKLQVPFAGTANPFTNATYVGGLNSAGVTFGGNLAFQAGMVRFDGVQMTEYGSYVESGTTYAKYVGAYEFTATPTGFHEQVPVWCDGKWTIIAEMQNINKQGNWETLAQLGLT